MQGEKILHRNIDPKSTWICDLETTRVLLGERAPKQRINIFSRGFSILTMGLRLERNFYQLFSQSFFKENDFQPLRKSNLTLKATRLAQ